MGEVFAGPEGLMERRGEKREGGRLLTLNGLVRVEGKTVDLLPFGRLTVTGCGAIVCEGDLRVGDVELSDPSRDFCALVSLGGSVRLAGSRYDCGIAALRGEVAPGRMQVKGFVAGDRIDPDLLRAGGLIRYDPRLNPEKADWNRFYTLALSPRVALFKDE